MKCAAIDIGTNTILMTVGEWSPSTGWKILNDYFHIPRLGEGIGTTGIISVEARNRAAEVLTKYAAILQEGNVEKVRAVATAALRTATNSAEVTATLQELLPCNIEVITGKEEATLTFTGSFIENGTSGTGVLIDIGGGSTELVFAENNSIQHTLSIPVGVVNLRDTLLAEQPIPTSAIDAVRKIFHEALAPYPKFCAPERTVAVAGTPMAIAALLLGTSDSDIDILHNSEFSAVEIERISTILQQLSIQQLHSLPGVHERRADVLAVGAVILHIILQHVQSPQLTVSAKGLRHGVLYSMRTL